MKKIPKAECVCVSGAGGVGGMGDGGKDTVKFL